MAGGLLSTVHALMVSPSLSMIINCPTLITGELSFFGMKILMCFQTVLPSKSLSAVLTLVSYFLMVNVHVRFEDVVPFERFTTLATGVQFSCRVGGLMDK